MATIAVFGMGYVGCVTGACLSRDGHHVIGVDADMQKVREIQSGVAPISEPGLSQLVAEQVGAERLMATNDAARAVRESDVALVCVGTPSTEVGGVDTGPVKSVIADIGRALRSSPKSYCVAVRSTVFPGTLEDELAPLLSRESGRELGDEISLCNNPEFLRESTAIRDHDNPPFILIGASNSAGARPVARLYDPTRADILITDTRTAAMVKYACNAFHALKVAFANEIGGIARATGADGHHVMELLCRDRKLNVSEAYLRPGFAFGGSCLPKDLRAMTRFIEQQGLRLPLIPSILPANDAQIRRAVDEVARLGQHRVGLVGLSFKRHTDDLRESPLVALAETLLGRGYDLRILDPSVRMSRLRGRNLAYVDRHLPHLARLLVGDERELFEHASLLVLGSNVADDVGWRSGFTGEVLDLRRHLAAAPSPQSVVEESAVNSNLIRHETASSPAH